MPKIRVVIPSNPSELIRLALGIKAKHEALADASPLKGLDWADIGPKIAQAASLDTDAAKFRRDAERTTKDRDNLVVEVGEAVRQTRDILLGLYRSNPRALGDFQFTVNETAQASVKKPNSQPVA